MPNDHMQTGSHGHTKTCRRALTRARLQVATAICTVLPIWESRAGLWVVVLNMVRCRPAVDEQALAELKADLEKPHMARVPGARASQDMHPSFQCRPWILAGGCVRLNGRQNGLQVDTVPSLTANVRVVCPPEEAARGGCAGPLAPLSIYLCTGGNPYATPEASHHGAQELALNPKLAPETANGNGKMMHGAANGHTNGNSAAP